MGTLRWWSREALEADIHCPTPPSQSDPPPPPPKLQLLLYIPGINERIKRAYQVFGVKTVHRFRSTLRSALVQVKQSSEDRKKKSVVYEVPCKNCECVYIGETSRNLEKCLSKHKNAVKKLC